MAFKQFSSYLEAKQGNFFTLRGDGDFADVVFLYSSYEDVMVCDTHYIKSANYEGYVQCCKDDYGMCPACSYGDRGIRRQTSLFIPLFNMSNNKVEFWDRLSSFEYLLNSSVFKNYPNPSEYVFRIIRHGGYRDTNTRYEIIANARNTQYPLNQILSDYNLSFPESYSMVCKSVTPDELTRLLDNNGPATNLGDYQYVPKPRTQAPTNEAATSTYDPAPAMINVPTPTFSGPPTDLPEYQMDTGAAPYKPSEAATSTYSTDDDIPGKADPGITADAVAAGASDIEPPIASIPEGADDSADSLDDVTF